MRYLRVAMAMHNTIRHYKGGSKGDRSMKHIIYCFKCNKYVNATTILYEDVGRDDVAIALSRSRIGDLEVACGHSRRERTGEDTWVKP